MFLINYLVSYQAHALNRGPRCSEMSTVIEGCWNLLLKSNFNKKMSIGDINL